MKFRTISYLMIAGVMLITSCSNHKLKKFKATNSAESSQTPGLEHGEATISDDEAARAAAALTSSPEMIVWKRYRALEAGLMDGLQLAKADVCVEAGRFSCIDQVHLTVLGGNEPYQNAQYERAQTPSALTPIAFERIILSSCGKRLSLDKGLGNAAVVFKHFPLSGAMPALDQVRKQSNELYQRFLARDATEEELGLAFGITKSMSSAEKIALGLCFVIGSSAENIFL